MKKILTILFPCFLFLISSCSCTKEDIFLRQALKAAGDNRKELQSVLVHYRYEDDDPLKLKAAKYLIANMPAHYSYADTAKINCYYKTAISLFGTGPNPDWQRDTTAYICMCDYPDLLYRPNTVSDIEIMKADFLIRNIDHAFCQWRNRLWSTHLTFEEFRDWVLPYKTVELQSLDNWRELLSEYYCDSINKVPADDVQRNSVWGAIEIVRNEIHQKQSNIGLRVIWEGQDIIPIRNAEGWRKMTYGTCFDYVTMGTAVFRSIGLPVSVDFTPSWGRNNDGHSWYVFLSDKGIEIPTINSLIVPAGMQFYPYERIPKVYRVSYEVNIERKKYNNKSVLKYPFEMNVKDVTDHYCRTSDVDITLKRLSCIKEKYAYVAMFNSTCVDGWNILDFGEINKGKAHFNKLGRDVLYIVLGYDGNRLIPISDPFVLQKNGSIIYLNQNREDYVKYDSLVLKRKYPESYNVVEMRKRIVGGKIQCANRPDFSDAKTLYIINTTNIPDKIQLSISNKPYRFWRYLANEGTYGSIAELAFFDENGHNLRGRPIACTYANNEQIGHAFDDDWLTNFETEQPNNNWIGMDFGIPETVYSVRIVPRSDDNDIHPGDEYELFQFNTKNGWKSIGGRRTAQGNSLYYEGVPENTLLWLVNYTRGIGERPFVLNLNKVTWW